MTSCFKCDGHLCLDKMYDLPRAFREYYCVNCGERFWIDTNSATLEIRPITMRYLNGALKN